MAWVKIADRSTYWEIGNAGNYAIPRPDGDVRGYWRIYYDNVPDITNNRTKIKTEYCIQTNGTDFKHEGLYSNSKINGVNNVVAVPNQYFPYNSITQYATGEVWVNHNSDGTGSFTWQGISSGSNYFNNSTAVSTYSLPSIPRATTINSFTWAKASGAAGLSRLTCSWATANSIDRIQYSLNGGAYTTVTGSGTSGSFNINSLTPNTQYSMRIKVRRADSQVETESGTLYATTYDIAKITGAPNNNVDMDNAQTITYTNPSGASLETSVYRTNASTVIASYRACSGTSYTFNFTSGEKTLFYNQIPTTKTLPLRIYLTTSDGLGNTYYNYVERTFEVFNANPTFTTWTYADTNPTTVALTGSNQKIIKGYSNVKATITSANKMVANKGATASSYQLTIGTKPSATVAYSSNATVEMTVNAVDNNVFNCYAIDSRDNSTKVTKTLTTDYINYTPISITSATATRTDNIGTETTLAFSGKIFDGSFGSVSNSVKTATYKFKKTTDASYTNGTSVITPTKTGGTFSFSGKIKGDEGSGGVDGFDATYSYNVQVIVTDELSTHTFNFILGSGTPNLAMHRDGIAINQPYDETLGGALQVGGDTYVDGALQVNGTMTYQPESLNNLNCNNLIGRVITGCGNSMTNRPPGSNNGYFENIPHPLNPTNYNMQRFIDRPFKGMWTRNMENGVWGDWVKILTKNDVVDNLNSTSTTDPLSAKQGKWLYDMLKARSQQPIGEYILFQSDGKTIVGNDTWHYLGTVYSLKSNLLEQYPLKTGYTRKYKLKLTKTDNKTNGSVYVRLQTPGGTNQTEYIYPNTWGSVGIGVRTEYILPITWETGVPPAHCDIHLTPDFATDGTVVVYQVSIVIYDELV